jgi:broad specificity phosphatase PhoE
MERLNQEPNPGSEKKELKVNIVRHGPSTYRQPEWDNVKTADDLNAIGQYVDGEKSDEEIAEGKKEAIEIIKKTADKIAAEIEPDEEIVIWSSPTGRTLETARIISEALQEKGIKIRKKGSLEESGIKTFKKLGEVKNFSWPLFEPLMNGGEIEHNGTKCTIDKSLSNPDGLGYPDYFTSDAIKNIPQEVKDKWPKDYVEEIEKFESFSEANKRMIDTLSRLKKVGDKKYRVIIVTHDALTGGVVKTFTHDEFSGINPGQLISIERKEDKLVAKRVGDITEGDSEKDVIKQ